MKLKSDGVTLDKSCHHPANPYQRIIIASAIVNVRQQIRGGTVCTINPSITDYSTGHPLAILRPAFNPPIFHRPSTGLHRSRAFRKEKSTPDARNVLHVKFVTSSVHRTCIYAWFGHGSLFADSVLNGTETRPRGPVHHVFPGGAQRFEDSFRQVVHLRTGGKLKAAAETHRSPSFQRFMIFPRIIINETKSLNYDGESDELSVITSKTVNGKIVKLIPKQFPLYNAPQKTLSEIIEAASSTESVQSNKIVRSNVPGNCGAVIKSVEFKNTALMRRKYPNLCSSPSMRDIKKVKT
ncbi:hypothetical protein DBV15_03465, partial [Temnothorax longispinosus]